MHVDAGDMWCMQAVMVDTRRPSKIFAYHVGFEIALETYVDAPLPKRAPLDRYLERQLTSKIGQIL